MRVHILSVTIILVIQCLTQIETFAGKIANGIDKSTSNKPKMNDQVSNDIEQPTSDQVLKSPRCNSKGECWLSDEQNNEAIDDDVKPLSDQLYKPPRCNYWGCDVDDGQNDEALKNEVEPMSDQIYKHQPCGFNPDIKCEYFPHDEQTDDATSTTITNSKKSNELSKKGQFSILEKLADKLERLASNQGV